MKRSAKELQDWFKRYIARADMPREISLNSRLYTFVFSVALRAYKRGYEDGLKAPGTTTTHVVVHPEEP